MPNLAVMAKPQSRAIVTRKPESLRAETRFNADGTVYQVVRLYNATGGALVKNRPYQIKYVGTSTTVQNPQVEALAAVAGARTQVVIADEAVANNSWGWFCFQGYHDCGVEGTTDVAAGDFLLVSAGVSTTGLVKDGTTRGQQSVAIACEAQAANSVVDKRVYLLGDSALTSIAATFAATTFTDTVTFGDSTITSPAGGASQWTFAPGAGSNGNIRFTLGSGKSINPTTNGQGALGASSFRWEAVYGVAGNFSGNITLAAGSNFILDATTGTKIGTATTQKIGFFNSTPVVQPSAYTQTFATADKTHANPTATALTAASGTADGTVDDVGGAFNQTTLNNNFQECASRINALIVDLADAKQLVNSVIDDLQALGLVG